MWSLSLKNARANFEMAARVKPELDGWRRLPATRLTYEPARGSDAVYDLTQRMEPS